MNLYFIVIDISYIYFKKSLVRCNYWCTAIWSLQLIYFWLIKSILVIILRDVRWFLKEQVFCRLVLFCQPFQKASTSTLDQWIYAFGSMWLPHVSNHTKASKRWSAVGRAKLSKLTHWSLYSSNKLLSKCPPLYAIAESFFFSHAGRNRSRCERFCTWWYAKEIVENVQTTSRISLIHSIPPDGYVEEVRKGHIFPYCQKTKLFTV